MSFPHYPAYKDSGVEWLGQVPAHWALKPIKYLVSCNDEVLPETTHPDAEFRYIEISDVDETEGIKNTQPIVFREAPSRARRVIRTDDIIISTVRTYLKAIARVHATLDGAVASTGFAVLRPLPEVDAPFLAFAMMAPHFLDRVVAHSVGISYPAINASDLIGLGLPLPPLPEQRAIAAFLDAETTRIDALVAKQEALIATLQEKRRALISHAVTKGLDPAAPMRDSGVPWLGEVPAHWEAVASRRFITDIEQGWSPQAEDRIAEAEEWAVIKLSAVSKGVFRPREHKTLPPDIEPDHRYEVRVGDLLLTRANTPELVGDVCVVKTVRDKLMLCDLVYRIAVDESTAHKPFVAYWLLSQPGRQQIVVDARGSSQSMVKVSQGHIRSWFVPLPPHREQVEIVEFLDQETTQIDTLIAKARAFIELLREHRTALIAAAVTGQIDVRGYAPEGTLVEM